MKTRNIQNQIQIKASPQQVFEALIKPSYITQWWLAASAIVIPKAGGIYAVTWGEDPDEPDYITIARVKEIEKYKKLTLIYEDYLSAQEGLPFEADFEVNFEIKEEEKLSILSVSQTGFPAEPIADQYYAGCVQGWKDTLKWIKFILESEA